jgi:hypothetical protein
MADFNWDEWNLRWWDGLARNEMWEKLRTGLNDDSGEPIYRSLSEVSGPQESPVVDDLPVVKPAAKRAKKVTE